MNRCINCDGLGFYFDPQCEADTCAHAGGMRTAQEIKLLRKQEEEDASAEGRAIKKISARLPRVMPCPPRSCDCSAGDSHREVLRKRADAQRHAFAMAKRRDR